LNMNKNSGQNLSSLLLDWYQENKRDLPWRRSKDPYSIWISEIMLQQTRVETVIPYYTRFLQDYPNVRALAEAGEEEILTSWKGLGYYSRARNLHRAAQMIQEKYQGIIPNAYEDLRLLPGIGDYTAGAVLSIAFNLSFPAVDGNVLRVVSRIAGWEEDIRDAMGREKIGHIVSGLIPPGRAGEFNQALMELGAELCIPKNPLCTDCPIRSCCSAMSTGRQSCIPVKKQAKSPVPLEYWVAVLRRDKSVLMQYRDQTALLGRMWGFPMLIKMLSAEPLNEFTQQIGLELREMRRLGETKHVFTHQVWRMEAIEFIWEETQNELPKGLAWIPFDKMDHIPIPRAFQKIIKLCDIGV